MSSKFNHPIEFECLLEVRNLRFALAHISWPWCDDLIALYGKFIHARRARPDLNVEMFIDTTPGTPPIYRKEALRKLFTVGYDIENNVMFGSDSSAEHYDASNAADLVYETSGITATIAEDKRILKDLEIPETTIAKYLSANLASFFR